MATNLLGVTQRTKKRDGRFVAFPTARIKNAVPDISALATGGQKPKL